MSTCVIRTIRTCISSILMVTHRRKLFTLFSIAKPWGRSALSGYSPVSTYRQSFRVNLTSNTQTTDVSETRVLSSSAPMLWCATLTTVFTSTGVLLLSDYRLRVCLFVCLSALDIASSITAWRYDVIRSQFCHKFCCTFSEMIVIAKTTDQITL